MVEFNRNRFKDGYHSASVSGTSDWEKVEVETDYVDYYINRAIILRQKGRGVTYFDNVCFTKINDDEEVIQ